jgi:hypothetical protein
VDTIRYNLDSLGWYQFERLAQVLLKAELGLGVESWGGRGDYGRDAFAHGPLKFPARDIESEGPFVFQVKFVEGANVPGAKFGPSLLAAVRSETDQIIERINKGVWTTPKHYALVTNCPLSADLRTQVSKKFKDAAKNLVTLGGKDVSDILDKNPAVARAFPQILSLRNLRELLEEIVNKETLIRSHAAVSIAQDIATVFVPTSAYNKAWRTLAEHSFVVLEGPPEMGKTAIAWMVALAQLANGWEAIACDEPNDLFRSHRRDASQVFVADDAFGRTEYDPTMGSRWEKQLGRAMTMLDDRHWLIWTSRKHILERARREMDLQGEVQDFPEPADVLVTASQLSDEEKGLILYRHAKAATLEAPAKALLKSNVKAIIRNPSFTPERIRRFVHESLPTIGATARKGRIPAQYALSQIQEAIRNPTDRMIKSFRALEEDHKWLLVSLLEQGHSPRVEDLRDSFFRFSHGSSATTFDQLLEELTEGFIKV